MRNVALLWLFLLCGAVAACGGSLPKGSNGGTGGHGGSGGSAGIDGGGGVGGQTTDATACACNLATDGATQVLTISWDCYCATYGCALANSCAAHNAFRLERTTYPDCGFTTYVGGPAGGPEVWVHDATGAEVGAQMTLDNGYFYCPSDHTLRASRLRAGQFPDSSCQGITCDCVAAAGGGGTGGSSSCSSTDAATP
jgi:hypothetical protein